MGAVVATFSVMRSIFMLSSCNPKGEVESGPGHHGYWDSRRNPVMCIRNRQTLHSQGLNHTLLEDKMAGSLDP
jgi:hypothetical protein